MNRQIIIPLVVLLGCTASSDPPIRSDGSSSSASAGGGGGDGGTGGGFGSSSSSSQGGGDGGAGGEEEAPLSDGVEVAVDTGTPALYITCHKGVLYWADQARGAAMRLIQSSAEEVHAPDGDGEIVIGTDRERLLVAVRSTDGSVAAIDEAAGSVETLHVGRVDQVAAGLAGIYWYDGQAILSDTGATVSPPSGLTSMAVDYDGPVWISPDERIFRAPADATVVLGQSGQGHYPGAITTYGASVAWGSSSGMKMMLFSGSGPYDFGADVQAVGSGDGVLVFCDRISGGYRILKIEASGDVSEVTSHATCVSVTHCGGSVYWSTVAGNILRHAASSD